MAVRRLLLTCLALAAASAAPAAAGVAVPPAPVFEGTLELAHWDDFSAGRPGFAWDLRLDDGQALRIDGGSVDAAPGSRVRVAGFRHGATLLADGSAQTVQAAATTSYGLGPKKVAVLLFNFSDNTTQPYTPDFARGIAFTNADSVAAYYNEASWAQLTMSGDVYGWYSLLDGSSTCNYTQWATDANAAATAAGVDLASYTNVVYAFPAVSACGWTGLAYLPGAQAWLNGTGGMTLHTMAHELGHNFGTHHASSLSCTDAGGARVSLSGSCSAAEYGDPFSVMGNASHYEHTDFSRANFGWLSPANTMTVSGPGTFTLEPLDTPDTSGTKVVRILRTSGTYFTLELRQPYGSLFDTFAASDPAVNGVLIRLAPDYSTLTQSQLIDATPATTSFGDAALAPGKTIYDPVSGLSFTTVSVSSTAAVVMVSNAADTTPPTSPAPLAARGANSSQISLSWSVSTDNVGVAGYRVYRSGTLLGTTASTSYTDSALAASTSYGYSVVAVDPADNASAAATATATTLAPADTTPPTAPGALAATAGGPTQITLSWTASTDNVGVAGYRVYRGSTQIATVPTTSYTDAGLAPSTPYSYSVVAYDAAGNTSAGAAASATTQGDTTAPSAPTALTAAAVDSSHVTLSWTASSDDVGVAGYRVYRGGVLVATVSSPGYADSGLAAATTYGYSVVAYDAAGNSSAAATASATTPNVTNPTSDTTPPTAPTKLTAALKKRAIALAWGASSDNVGVSGYRVSRDGTVVATVSGSTLKYTDNNAPRGSHTYAVVAYDAAGNTSSPASVAVAV